MRGVPERRAHEELGRKAQEDAVSEVMLKRVTNAIKAEFGKAFDAKPLTPGGIESHGDWFATGDPGSLDLRLLARAAIEALREPSDAVIDAVQTEVDIWPDDAPKPSPHHVVLVSREEAEAIWRAGIDAALK